MAFNGCRVHGKLHGTRDVNPFMAMCFFKGGREQIVNDPVGLLHDGIYLGEIQRGVEESGTQVLLQVMPRGAPEFSDPV